MQSTYTNPLQAIVRDQSAGNWPAHKLKPTKHWDNVEIENIFLVHLEQKHIIVVSQTGFSLKTGEGLSLKYSNNHCLKIVFLKHSLNLYQLILDYGVFD